jgi:D-alanyl-D-alanine carboxypeptidase
MQMNDIRRFHPAGFLFLAGVLLSASLLSLAGCGPGKGPGAYKAPGDEKPGPEDPVQVRMEAYVKAAEREWGFRGCVLVARGGETIFQTARGPADAENDIPNGPGTRFQIASVSKVFTAAAVMKLADTGMIDPEAPAVRYLPDLKDLLGPEVKVGHLLSHSSGLPEYMPGLDSGLKMSEPVEPGALIDAVRGRKSQFPPGQEVRYSNVGYVLLGLAVENVTGESYFDWLGGHVLNPLGLNETGVVPDYPSRPGFAKGYVEVPGGGWRPAPFVHPSWGSFAGALSSTVGDLLEFDRALSSPGFLGAQTLEEMFRPRNKVFCYGWLVNEAFKRRAYGHGGGAPGFSSWIERWPADDLFVAVLSNVTTTPAGEIGRSLAAIVFGEPWTDPVSRIPLRLESAELREFEGGYRLEDGDIRRLVLEGNVLFVTRSPGSKHPLLPCDKDTFFFPTDRGAFIRFVRDDQGRITGHFFHQLGLDEFARKIGS